MREEAVKLGVPFRPLKPEDMPVASKDSKPLIRETVRDRHGRNPAIYRYIPQDGSKYIHDSRYLKFYDSPRDVFYLQNQIRQQTQPKITTEKTSP